MKIFVDFGKSTKIFKILCYPDTDSLLSGHRFFAIRTPTVIPTDYPKSMRILAVGVRIAKNLRKILQIFCQESSQEKSKKIFVDFGKSTKIFVNSLKSTKIFVDLGESVRTTVGVRRAKNLRKFSQIFFWLTENSLGQ